MLTRQVKKVVAKPRPMCDKCGDTLKSGPVYYDASVPLFGGSWAWLCDFCFKHSGAKLGPGLGQKYDSHTDIKLEG